MQSKAYFKFRNCGFSLVELAISLGVLSIAGLIISGFSASAIGFVSNAQKHNQMNQTFELVRITLANQCTLNLQGTPISMTSPSGTLMSAITSYNAITSLPQDSVVVNGLNSSGVYIQSIALVPKVQVNTSLILANLQISFGEPTESGVLQSLVRNISVFAEVNGGKVKKCWMTPDNASIDSNQICLSTTNGQYDQYDPVTKQCSLANSTWYDGTTTTASCPAGTSLPSTAYFGYYCQGKTPAGFVDPFPSNNVPLNSGTVSVRHSYVNLAIDRATSTCNCSWATDIAVDPSFKCQILCVTQ